MLRVIHVRVIVDSFVILYCSLVRRISGHVLCLYKVLSFAALSLSFLFFFFRLAVKHYQR